ncbi:MAG: hypothetical protein ACYTFA_03375 [Planctomycetota bacterium]|jgi:hypothetical protein
MKHWLLTGSTITALLILTGCTRSMTSSTLQQDFPSVLVHFVLPSEQARYTGVDTQADAHLVSDSSYVGFSSSEYGDGTTTESPSAYHVALWGGPYNGTNVTTRPAALPPGSYTFAYFDQTDSTALQGWLDVHNTGSDLVSVLRKWRDGITEQKLRLAYGLEIDGRMNVSDPEVFSSFEKQMQAFNRLQRQLETAISTEYRAQELKQAEICDLLRHADVVIMPSKDPFFGPTAQPTFSEGDLETIRAGDAMTKIVVAADYNQARWKLRRLNELYDDVSRLKEVLRQEADRLERRKGMFLLTDHLYRQDKHSYRRDKQFLENETQLQHTLGMIDRFHTHALDLRERRMALAFITSLFAPDTSFNTLDEEGGDLLRERTVLETELRRLDRLFEETSEQSVRRVALERSRQNVMGMIESIKDQIDDIEQARTVLAEMTEATNVIHRHNDTRLLTTTFVADRLPPSIRKMVEREAMMSVRLETAGDRMFVPRPTSVTAMRMDPRAGAQDRNITTRHHSEVSADTRHSRTTAGLTVEPEDKKCPWFARLFVPPCWFANDTDHANKDERD